MPEPDQEAREAPPSIAPVQVERANDELDLAGMRGRRGPRIVVAVVVLAAASFGVVRMLQSMDAHQAYSEAAAQLERSEVEQRQAFMRCALPNQALSSQAALQGSIEIAAERMGKTYAKVLTKCTPLLENFQQSIAAIQAPADTAADVKAVSNAANAFAATWLGLRDFLQSSSGYDREQTAPRIQAITSAWETYSDQRTKAKAALAARF